MHTFNWQTAAGRDGLFLCLSTLLSDWNGRGWVNFVDFATLTLYWIEVDCDLGDFWCNGADFTRNGEVNLDDLAKFITYWLIGVN